MNLDEICMLQDEFWKDGKTSRLLIVWMTGFIRSRDVDMFIAYMDIVEI